jgi:hypothetical protein
MISSTGFKSSLFIHLCVVLFLLLDVASRAPLQPAERIISVDISNIRSGSITNLKNKIPTKAHIKDTMSKGTATSVKPVAMPQDNTATLKAKEKAKEKLKDDINTLVSSNKNQEIEKVLSQLENASTAAESSRHVEAASDKPFDSNLPVTIADHDNIKMQIERKFFNPIVADFAPGELVIRLKLDLKKNGEIDRVTVLNSSVYSSRHAEAFASLKDGLVRAVHMASPLVGLSEESYDGNRGWKEIELVFDAHYLMQIG